VLDAGVLTYGKSPGDVSRGRTHGRIDVGPAVISTKTEVQRIDIDDEQYIHHLKAPNSETFALWLEQLHQHRLYQQSLWRAAGIPLARTTSPEGETGGGNQGVAALPAAAAAMAGGVSPHGGSLPRGVRPPMGAGAASAANWQVKDMRFL